MAVRKITTTVARRLAIAAQGLAGSQPATVTPEAMLELLRRIRCLQLDPIRAVERSHYLVLWSRLGNYDRDILDRLAYRDKHLFEYWAHAASLVLTEDYPLHAQMMCTYPQRGSSWDRRLVAWAAANKAFHNYILAALKKNGPMRTGDFENLAKVPWTAGGWTTERSVAYMLDYLWTRGKVLVSQRNGLNRWWDLSQRVLPDRHPRQRLSAHKATRDAAQKSLKALGIARQRDINKHFTQGRYPGLKTVLPTLCKQKKIQQIGIEEWPGDWYLHTDLLPLLEQIADGDWQPRTTLLSPFDNLIRDRQRTEMIWNFHYRMEIYVPPQKRRYGYYVMPILDGERLIGRIDPRMDHRKKVLTINAVHVEPSTRVDRQTGWALAGAIARLARFLGADQLKTGPRMPKVWRSCIAQKSISVKDYQ